MLDLSFVNKHQKWFACYDNYCLWPAKIHLRPVEFLNCQMFTKISLNPTLQHSISIIARSRLCNPTDWRRYVQEDRLQKNFFSVHRCGRGGWPPGVTSKGMGMSRGTVGMSKIGYVWRGVGMSGTELVKGVSVCLKRVGIPGAMVYQPPWTWNLGDPHISDT